MLYLALDDLASPTGAVRVRTRDTQYLGGVADWSQGVAQFMPQHGEKFILLPVRLAKLLIQQGIVQGDRRPVRQILYQRQIRCLKDAAARTRCETKHTDRP